jgi:hypothetical protein
MHFWQVVILGAGGTFAPVKYGLSGVMPAFINNMDGSFLGIREKLLSLKCSLDSKNERNLSLISLSPMFSM